MELAQKHKNQNEQFKRDIDEGRAVNNRVHYSQEILELQKKAEHLSAQGWYAEAKALQKKLKKLTISVKNEKTGNFKKIQKLKVVKMKQNLMKY